MSSWRGRPATSSGGRPTSSGAGRSRAGGSGTGRRAGGRQGGVRQAAGGWGRSGGASPRGGPGRSGWGRVGTEDEGRQVEGRQAVAALLAAGRRQVRRVYLAEDQEPAAILDEIERRCRERRIPLELVPPGRLAQLARTQQPQGVVALAEPVRSVDLDDLVGGGDPALLVVLDGVSDPQNVGSLFRSAACLGASGLVLPRHRSCELTPTVLKVAAGGVEHLAVSRVPGVPAALATLERLGCLTLGLSERAERSLYDLEDQVFWGPLALVLGSEGSGLRRLSAARCQELVRIPLSGALPSLNVAVAGAVALAEVARRRRLRRPG